MENKNMTDGVPYKKETVITSELNCNTGQGKISKAHLNQERYQISCGIAVVINNVEFEPNLNLGDRFGSEKDALTLFQSFKQLGFKSERLNNVTENEMTEKFNKIKEDKKSLAETDCIVIVLMTHGTEESVFMTDVSIKTKNIMNYFNAENCPELQLKPKIFILQACRGTGLGGGVEMEVVPDKEKIEKDPNEADAAGIYLEHDQAYGELVRIPNEADFLAVYSSSSGYKSFRNTDTGSPFVDHLSRELLGMTHDDNFYNVLTRVNKNVGIGYKPSLGMSGIVTQMPCFSSHLTKELFFNMKEMANRGKKDAHDEDPSSFVTEKERNTGQGSINQRHLDQKRYSIKSGIAIVINNTEFDARLKLADRKTSDADAASLYQRFLELGFESDILTDVTKDDLEEKFREITKDEKQLKETGCLIVAVLSHGDEDSVYMTDKPVKFKAVMDYFNAQNCPELILQPKIFIFQCSRRSASRQGEDLTFTQMKMNIPCGLETVRIPNEADFLAVYSTSLGDRSFDSTEDPSPFVHQLWTELQKMKKEDDIYTVLTKVNNKVMRFEPANIDSKFIRQMPYFVSHLTKDLFLKQIN